MKNIKILTIVWGIDEKHLFTGILVKNGKILREISLEINDKKGLKKLLRFIIFNNVELILIENPFNLKYIRRKIFGRKSISRKKWRKKFELIILSFYALQQNLKELGINYRVIESRIKHYMLPTRILA